MHPETATPAIPFASPPSDKELPFRQLHLDFHTSPLIPGIGSDFQADEFAATLTAANVNSINLFAKDCHGMSYYPTKVGEMHPHLHFDLLGSMIEGCHRRGIRTPIYISVMFDSRCSELHSDWRVLDEDGEPIGATPLQAGWIYICPNTPYIDYLEALTEEVARTYDADGFWFDILVSPPQGCFCSYCMADREKMGLDSTKQEDRVRHYETVLTLTMQRLTAAVRRHKRSALIYLNGRVRIGDQFRKELRFFTHLEIESLPGGIWGYGYFSLMSRYIRRLGLDYLGMTARFHRTWGDFGTIRNQAALDYECFRMLASAAKCSIGDQLHPRGQLDPEVYRRIGVTYKSVQEKEPWCTGATSATDIGVVSDASYIVTWRVRDSDLGATQMLSELHLQFDFLDWESDFSDYKLLILPDSQRLTPDMLAKIRAYLGIGGKLLLNHESGLDSDGRSFALEECGIEYVGPSPYQGDKGDYFQSDILLGEDLKEMVQFTDDAGSEVKLKGSTQMLARLWKPYFDRNYLHFCSHAQTPWDEPEENPVVTRNGNIIYISFAVFQSYHRNGYAPLKALVAKCLEALLPDPLIRVQAPSIAEVTVTDQKGRRIVHLLHYPKERRGDDLDVVEDVIPLHNIPLSVRLPSPPSQVYTAPDLRSLQVSYGQGYAEVTVPVVRGHTMVVFEASDR